MQTPTEILDSRDDSHGNWPQQAACARDLKSVLLKHGLLQLPPGVGESLDMIMVKVSRIMLGNFAFKDHWDDLAGYALCGKEAALEHQNRLRVEEQAAEQAGVPHQSNDELNVFEREAPPAPDDPNVVAPSDRAEHTNVPLHPGDLTK